MEFYDFLSIKFEPVIVKIFFLPTPQRDKTPMLRFVPENFYGTNLNIGEKMNIKSAGDASALNIHLLSLNLFHPNLRRVRGGWGRRGEVG